MDRSLDEIVAESQQRKRGSRPRRGTPRERDSYPRDGVRKSTRDDSRGVDSDWVHDKFEDTGSRNRPRNPKRRHSPEPYQETRGTKLKVENLHWDLTKDDLEGLFGRIGPILKLELLYDRAGRSEGVAFVTYDRREHATEAIREFDGANAKGQPIRLTIMASAPRRNPFDTAHMPGRSLADRITRPRSLSPNDRSIDRYVPGGGGSRSRSPMPRRRGGGGRRPGARREGGTQNERGGGGGGSGGGHVGRDGRPKKTQEELDAEMDDYFGPSGSTDAVAPATGAASATNGQAVDDVDMIE
ncbi:hypothetical protein F4775DRAFT_565501 [Biscogniauxia sp. FL1348]|nr:hypothetical protein F4775DRAFT_565501 [Biscogniauxia sp. FL1348]